MKLMRIISGILASVLTAGCLLYSAPPKGIPAPALIAYADSLGEVDFGDLTYTVDGLTFSVYDNSATLTKCNTSAAGAIIEIPAECKGKPVTMIAPSAFKNCRGITSISMPDSVEKIGKSAFEGARDINLIKISKNVCEIPERCFYSCENLGNVILSEKMNRAYTDSFHGASIDTLTIMNPSLDLSFLENSFVSIKTVCGYPDSTAEIYAKQLGKPFIALEGTPPTTTTTTMPRITTTTRMAVTTWVTTTTRATTQKASISTKSSIVLQDGLKKFDINKDNRVTIADAVLLTRFVSEDAAAVLPQNSEPDVDADGLVTIEDVMSVLHALQPFSIQIGKATAKPGEKVTVPIKIYADKGTAAGQIYVGCDSKLTPVSVKSGDAYTMNFYADCESYPITITWTAKGGKDQIAKNGSILAELEFEVDPNIKSPEYLEISIMNQAGSYTTSFSDSSGNTYTAGYRSGYITVIP